ncbi:hypothetical protein H5410_028040 [Solanum commersonii]|uniref:F-box associated beta-propeller type 3 domain-containing protein n=1 Tax=Solanum commersonii TaxID=4109 RepID=A0A9J5Z538_SOLCO|nr:hypothetical protein H5410_028040 [Solanum commersonii]
MLVFFDLIIEILLRLVEFCKWIDLLANITKELFQWNPTIRKHRKLPSFKPKVINVYFFLYGFGYDEIQDDYKVVCIFINIGHQCDFQENGTRLISSGEFMNGKLRWATTSDLWSVKDMGIKNLG